MRFATLFTSKAKVSVLRILSRRTAPIHLRELAREAEMGVRSIQLAVESLVELGVLEVSSEKNRKLFTLRQEGIYDLSLRDFFTAEVNREIRGRTKHYPDLLPLLERIDEMRMVSWDVKARLLESNEPRD